MDAVHREWGEAERQVWEERDRVEQAELAGHANAPVTAEEEALPGACYSPLSLT